MPRPSDWSPLGLSCDPAPGDPGAVQQVVTRLETVRQSIADARTGVDSSAARIGDDACIDGTGHVPLAEIHSRTGHLLGLLDAALEVVSSAVSSYHVKLLTTQAEADGALRRAPGLAERSPQLAAEVQNVTSARAELDTAGRATVSAIPAVSVQPPRLSVERPGTGAGTVQEALGLLRSSPESPSSSETGPVRPFSDEDLFVRVRGHLTGIVPEGRMPDRPDVLRHAAAIDLSGDGVVRAAGTVARDMFSLRLPGGSSTGAAAPRIVSDGPSPSSANPEMLSGSAYLKRLWHGDEALFRVTRDWRSADDSVIGSSADSWNASFVRGQLVGPGSAVLVAVGTDPAGLAYRGEQDMWISLRGEVAGPLDLHQVSEFTARERVSVLSLQARDAASPLTSVVTKAVLEEVISSGTPRAPQAGTPFAGPDSDVEMDEAGAQGVQDVLGLLSQTPEGRYSDQQLHLQVQGYLRGVGLPEKEMPTQDDVVEARDAAGITGDRVVEAAAVVARNLFGLRMEGGASRGTDALTGVAESAPQASGEAGTTSAPTATPAGLVYLTSLWEGDSAPFRVSQDWRPAGTPVTGASSENWIQSFLRSQRSEPGTIALVVAGPDPIGLAYRGAHDVWIPLPWESSGLTELRHAPDISAQEAVSVLVLQPRASVVPAVSGVVNAVRQLADRSVAAVPGVRLLLGKSLPEPPEFEFALKGRQEYLLWDALQANLSQAGPGSSAVVRHGGAAVGAAVRLGSRIFWETLAPTDGALMSEPLHRAAGRGVLPRDGEVLVALLRADGTATPWWQRGEVRWAERHVSEPVDAFYTTVLRGHVHDALETTLRQELGLSKPSASSPGTNVVDIDKDLDSTLVNPGDTVLVSMNGELLGIAHQAGPERLWLSAPAAAGYGPPDHLWEKGLGAGTDYRAEPVVGRPGLRGLRGTLAQVARRTLSALFADAPALIEVLYGEKVDSLPAPLDLAPGATLSQGLARTLRWHGPGATVQLRRGDVHLGTAHHHAGDLLWLSSDEGSPVELLQNLGAEREARFSGNDVSVSVTTPLGKPGAWLTDDPFSALGPSWKVLRHGVSDPSGGPLRYVLGLPGHLDPAVLPPLAAGRSTLLVADGNTTSEVVLKDVLRGFFRNVAGTGQKTWTIYREGLSEGFVRELVALFDLDIIHLRSITTGPPNTQVRHWTRTRPYRYVSENGGEAWMVDDLGEQPHIPVPDDFGRLTADLDEAPWPMLGDRVTVGKIEGQDWAGYRGAGWFFVAPLHLEASGWAAPPVENDRVTVVIHDEGSTRGHVEIVTRTVLADHQGKRVRLVLPEVSDEFAAELAADFDIDLVFSRGRLKTFRDSTPGKGRYRVLISVETGETDDVQQGWLRAYPSRFSVADPLPHPWTARTRPVLVGSTYQTFFPSILWDEQLGRTKAPRPYAVPGQPGPVKFILRTRSGVVISDDRQVGAAAAGVLADPARITVSVAQIGPDITAETVLDSWRALAPAGVPVLLHDKRFDRRDDRKPVWTAREMRAGLDNQTKVPQPTTGALWRDEYDRALADPARGEIVRLDDLSFWAQRVLDPHRIQVASQAAVQQYLNAPGQHELTSALRQSLVLIYAEALHHSGLLGPRKVPDQELADRVQAELEHLRTTGTGPQRLDPLKWLLEERNYRGVESRDGTVLQAYLDRKTVPAGPRRREILVDNLSQIADVLAALPGITGRPPAGEGPDRESKLVEYVTTRMPATLRPVDDQALLHLGERAEPLEPEILIGELMNRALSERWSRLDVMRPDSLQVRVIDDLPGVRLVEARPWVHLVPRAGVAQADVQKLAVRMAVGIRDSWNGTDGFRAHGRTVFVRVRPEITYGQLVSGSAAAFIAVHPGSGRATSDHVYVTTSAQTLSHEVAHRMGLADRYPFTPGDAVQPLRLRRILLKPGLTFPPKEARFLRPTTLDHESALMHGGHEVTERDLRILYERVMARHSHDTEADVRSVPGASAPAPGEAAMLRPTGHPGIDTLKYHHLAILAAVRNYLQHQGLGRLLPALDWADPDGVGGLPRLHPLVIQTDPKRISPSGPGPVSATVKLKAEEPYPGDYLVIVGFEPRPESRRTPVRVKVVPDFAAGTLTRRLLTLTGPERTESRRWWWSNLVGPATYQISGLRGRIPGAASIMAAQVMNAHLPVGPGPEWRDTSQLESARRDLSAVLAMALVESLSRLSATPITTDPDAMPRILREVEGLAATLADEVLRPTNGGPLPDGTLPAATDSDVVMTDHGAPVTTGSRVPDGTVWNEHRIDGAVVLSRPGASPTITPQMLPQEPGRLALSLDGFPAIDSRLHQALAAYLQENRAGIRALRILAPLPDKVARNLSARTGVDLIYTTSGLDRTTGTLLPVPGAPVMSWVRIRSDAMRDGSQAWLVDDLGPVFAPVPSGPDLQAAPVGAVAGQPTSVIHLGPRDSGWALHRGENAGAVTRRGEVPALLPPGEEDGFDLWVPGDGVSPDTQALVWSAFEQISPARRASVRLILANTPDHFADELVKAYGTNLVYSRDALRVDGIDGFRALIEPAPTGPVDGWLQARPAADGAVQRRASGYTIYPWTPWEQHLLDGTRPGIAQFVAIPDSYGKLVRDGQEEPRRTEGAAMNPHVLRTSAGLMGSERGILTERSVRVVRQMHPERATVSAAQLGDGALADQFLDVWRSLLPGARSVRLHDEPRALHLPDPHTSSGTFSRRALPVGPSEWDPAWDVLLTATPGAAAIRVSGEAPMRIDRYRGAMPSLGALGAALGSVRELTQVMRHALLRLSEGFELEQGRIPHPSGLSRTDEEQRAHLNDLLGREHRQGRPDALAVMHEKLEKNPPNKPDLEKFRANLEATGEFVEHEQESLLEFARELRSMTGEASGSLDELTGLRAVELRAAIRDQLTQRENEIPDLLTQVLGRLMTRLSLRSVNLDEYRFSARVIDIGEHVRAVVVQPVILLEAAPGVTPVQLAKVAARARRAMTDAWRTSRGVVEGAHTVFVRADPQVLVAPDQHRPADRTITVYPGRRRADALSIHLGDNAFVLAHELSHALGLGDHYGHDPAVVDPLRSPGRRIRPAAFKNPDNPHVPESWKKEPRVTHAASTALDLGRSLMRGDGSTPSPRDVREVYRRVRAGDTATPRSGERPWQPADGPQDLRETLPVRSFYVPSSAPAPTVTDVRVRWVGDEATPSSAVVAQPVVDPATATPSQIRQELRNVIHTDPELREALTAVIRGGVRSHVDDPMPPTFFTETRAFGDGAVVNVDAVLEHTTAPAGATTDWVNWVVAGADLGPTEAARLRNRIRRTLSDQDPAAWKKMIQSGVSLQQGTVTVKLRFEPTTIVHDPKEPLEEFLIRYVSAYGDLTVARGEAKKYRTGASLLIDPLIFMMTAGPLGHIMPMLRISAGSGGSRHHGSTTEIQSGNRPLVNDRAEFWVALRVDAEVTRDGEAVTMPEPRPLHLPGMDVEFAKAFSTTPAMRAANVREALATPGQWRERMDSFRVSDQARADLAAVFSAVPRLWAELGRLYQASPADWEPLRMAFVGQAKAWNHFRAAAAAPSPEVWAAFAPVVRVTPEFWELFVNAIAAWKLPEGGWPTVAQVLSGTTELWDAFTQMPVTSLTAATLSSPHPVVPVVEPDVLHGLKPTINAVNLQAVLDRISELLVERFGGRTEAHDELMDEIRQEFLGEGRAKDRTQWWGSGAYVSPRMANAELNFDGYLRMGAKAVSVQYITTTPDNVPIRDDMADTYTTKSGEDVRRDAGVGIGVDFSFDVDHHRFLFSPSLSIPVLESHTVDHRTVGLQGQAKIATMRFDKLVRYRAVYRFTGEIVSSHGDIPFDVTTALEMGMGEKDADRFEHMALGGEHTGRRPAASRVPEPASNDFVHDREGNQKLPEPVLAKTRFGKASPLIGQPVRTVRDLVRLSRLRHPVPTPAAAPPAALQSPRTRVLNLFRPLRRKLAGGQAVTIRITASDGLDLKDLRGHSPQTSYRWRKLRAASDQRSEAEQLRRPSTVFVNPPAGDRAYDLSFELDREGNLIGGPGRALPVTSPFGPGKLPARTPLGLHRIPVASPLGFGRVQTVGDLRELALRRPETVFEVELPARFDEGIGADWNRLRRLRPQNLRVVDETTRTRQDLSARQIADLTPIVDRYVVAPDGQIDGAREMRVTTRRIAREDGTFTEVGRRAPVGFQVNPSLTRTPVPAPLDQTLQELTRVAAGLESRLTSLRNQIARDGQLQVHYSSAFTEMLRTDSDLARRWSAVDEVLRGSPVVQVLEPHGQPRTNPLLEPRHRIVLDFRAPLMEDESGHVTVSTPQQRWSGKFHPEYREPAIAAAGRGIGPGVLTHAVGMARVFRDFREKFEHLRRVTDQDEKLSMRELNQIDRTLAVRYGLPAILPQGKTLFTGSGIHHSFVIGGVTYEFMMSWEPRGLTGPPVIEANVALDLQEKGTVSVDTGRGQEKSIGVDIGLHVRAHALGVLYFDFAFPELSAHYGQGRSNTEAHASKEYRRMRTSGAVHRFEKRMRVTETYLARDTRSRAILAGGTQQFEATSVTTVSEHMLPAQPLTIDEVLRTGQSTVLTGDLNSGTGPLLLDASGAELTRNDIPARQISGVMMLFAGTDVIVEQIAELVRTGSAPDTGLIRSMLSRMTGVPVRDRRPPAPGPELTAFSDAGALMGAPEQAQRSGTPFFLEALSRRALGRGLLIHLPGAADGYDHAVSVRFGIYNLTHVEATNRVQLEQYTEGDLRSKFAGEWSLSGHIGASAGVVIRPPAPKQQGSAANRRGGPQVSGGAGVGGEKARGGEVAGLDGALVLFLESWSGAGDYPTQHYVGEFVASLQHQRWRTPVFRRFIAEKSEEIHVRTGNGFEMWAPHVAALRLGLPGTDGFAPLPVPEPDVRLINERSLGVKYPIEAYTADAVLPEILSMFERLGRADGVWDTTAAWFKSLVVDRNPLRDGRDQVGTDVMRGLEAYYDEESLRANHHALRSTGLTYTIATPTTTGGVTYTTVVVRAVEDDTPPVHEGARPDLKITIGGQMFSQKGHSEHASTVRHLSGHVQGRVGGFDEHGTRVPVQLSYSRTSGRLEGEGENETRRQISRATPADTSEEFSKSVTFEIGIYRTSEAPKVLQSVADAVGEVSKRLPDVRIEAPEVLSRIGDFSAAHTPELVLEWVRGMRDWWARFRDSSTKLLPGQARGEYRFLAASHATTTAARPPSTVVGRFTPRVFRTGENPFPAAADVVPRQLGEALGEVIQATSALRSEQVGLWEQVAANRPGLMHREPDRERPVFGREHAPGGTDHATASTRFSERNLTSGISSLLGAAKAEFYRDGQKVTSRTEYQVVHSDGTRSTVEFIPTRLRWLTRGPTGVRSTFPSTRSSRSRCRRSSRAAVTTAASLSGATPGSRSWGPTTRP